MVKNCTKHGNLYKMKGNSFSIIYGSLTAAVKLINNQDSVHLLVI